MSEFNDYHYIYQHVDPVTKEIVYVGSGSGQRAWMMRNSGGLGPRYGHRSPEHYKWFRALEHSGYTLLDIVVILEKQLNKEEATKKERKLVLTIKPRYNRQKGPNSMVDPTRVKEAVQLRELGLSYSQIAAKLNIAPMTAWRNVNER